MHISPPQLIEDLMRRLAIYKAECINYVKLINYHEQIMRVATT